MCVVMQYASVSSSVYSVTLIHSRQALLVVVLLITVGINVMFILDTNRRLHEETSTTGRPTYSLSNSRTTEDVNSEHKFNVSKNFSALFIMESGIIPSW